MMRSMKRSASLACLVSLSWLVGCGAAPPGSVSQPIINGQDDSGDPAVVMLVSQVPGSKSASLCTGEIISPHVILTAAHCVDPAVIGTGAQTFVFTGPVFDFNAPSGLIAAAATHYDTAFDQNAPQNGHDIGVVILKTPTTIAPVPYNRTPITAAMAGQAARLVGYGITAGNDQTGKTAGTRREAPSKLLQINPANDALLDFEDDLHTICEGDSGGPAFMMIDGQERIVGVTSFGYQTCPTTMPGTDTRVDRFTSFIDPYVMQHDPPAVPEGGACASDADCAPRRCVATSTGKVCTDACDPAATPSTCTDGTQCTDVDGQPLCIKPMPTSGGNGNDGGKGGRSGCDVGHGAPAGPALLLLAAAWALAIARRRLT